MVVSCFFILDLKGKILISRNYRGDIPVSSVAVFSQKIHDSDECDLKPVFTEDKITYAYIRVGNLYLLSLTKINANITMVLMFLYRLADIFKGYFGKLDEDSVRDNFVIIYELLDEVMDFGYPQVTEGNILSEYITQESHKSDVVVKPPAAVTNAVSWRSEGISHKKNEVFLDVVERLNMLIGKDGNVVHSEIVGAVEMKCNLSGMPELKLGLNDKVMMSSSGRESKGKSIELEDIRFHQCVRLARFEHDRTISFIPPDGAFQLMSYRLAQNVKPLLAVKVDVDRKQSSMEFVVSARSNFKVRSVANDVRIVIPVPADVDTPKFKATIGSASYKPGQDAVVWKIKQFSGHREFMLKAHFGLPSEEREDEVEDKRPVSVTFEIPYFTVSGIQVRFLKIMEKSQYQALPWVRYITKNGDYAVRME
eukprot:TRINITY_DN779977_c0_g1_i1.p1 TRINITY_DN779977_c0_g1~~TRINITY_DN779977_c0_g1_i1.p1  ORF type:complete len:423 (-),score=102.98 TRINITY_DN779977_c0_g1_i1:211-1479(-)